MFKWLFKKSLKRASADMSNLVNGSMLIVTGILAHRYKNEFGDGAMRVAAGVVNYLFGKPLDGFSSQEQEQAKKLANEILHGDRDIKEIVVQSLRIRSMLQLERTGAPSIFGIEILEEHGASVPNAPSPEEHRILLQYLIGMQPESMHEELLSMLSMYHLE